MTIFHTSTKAVATGEHSKHVIIALLVRTAEIMPLAVLLSHNSTLSCIVEFDRLVEEGTAGTAVEY